jgi:hypothetical protein
VVDRDTEMKKHSVLSLRLPPELHRQLVEWASARYPRKSLNAEIVERLTRSFNPDYQPIEKDELEDLRERLARIERFIYGDFKENE